MPYTDLHSNPNAALRNLLNMDVTGPHKAHYSRSKVLTLTLHKLHVCNTAEQSSIRLSSVH